MKRPLYMLTSSSLFRTLGLPVALCLALLLSAAPAAAEQGSDCRWSPWFSEETKPVACPEGMAASGLRCRGDFCDEKSLLCCEYAPRKDRLARYDWSPWFSEERPGGFRSEDGFLSGMGCEGRFCDDVRVEELISRNLPNTGDCYDSPWFSEESRNPEAACSDGHFIAGVGCRGKYCDELSIQCCRAGHEGAGSCEETALVSEETRPARCPQGYAMSGLRCEGRYCDNKTLICCPYEGRSSQDRRPGGSGWSPWVSEEDRDGFRSTRGFAVGLECRGRYCDEVRLEMMEDRGLRNSGRCEGLPFVSEEQPENAARCPGGSFVSGILCRGDYCDALALECCQTR